MTFNIFHIVYVTILFFVLNGCSVEMVFILWYSLGLFSLRTLHSHIGFILLTLELLTIITIALSLLFILKNRIELSFFFLILCLIVGEAYLGLSLLVISSRFQKKEILSLSLVQLVNLIKTNYLVILKIPTRN